MKIKRGLNSILSTTLLMTLLVSAFAATPAFAAAPGTGTVYEGVSIPGAQLGNTRAEVEMSFGAPSYCQSVEVGGDMAYCTFTVEGGGQVDVRYRGADGGNASNLPDDVAYHFRWSQPVDGWTTTAGVNTSLAINDPDAAIAAYPDAEVIYNPTFGNIESIEDKSLGILIDYHFAYLSGTLSVSMAISYPTSPPPPPPPPPDDELIHVTGIDLTVKKKNVNATVNVQDEQGANVSGAVVSATWTLPNGSSVSVSGQTDSQGNVSFAQQKERRRGTYTLTINTVTLDGSVFDEENSVLSNSIYK